MRLTRLSCLAVLSLAWSCADPATPPPLAPPETPDPAAPPCAFSAPAEVFVPAQGGELLVEVTASPSGCSPDNWNAETIDAGGSITGLGSPSGYGSGTFTLNTANNSGAARTGAIRVTTPSPAAPLKITVRQPVKHCSFDVAVNTPRVSRLNTSVHVTVTNPEGCSWRAEVSPNPSTFLRFYDQTSDGGMTARATGTAVLHVAVAENGAPPGAQTRSGTMRITSLATGIEVGSVTITQTAASQPQRPDPGRSR